MKNHSNDITTWRHLHILADHLETNVKPEDFYFPSYRAAKYSKDVSGRSAFFSVPYKGQDDCGTVGCALGNGPFVNHNKFKPILSDFGRNGLNWERYAERLFPHSKRSREMIFNDPIWIHMIHRKENNSITITIMVLILRQCAEIIRTEHMTSPLIRDCINKIKEQAKAGKL